MNTIGKIIGKVVKFIMIGFLVLIITNIIGLIIGTLRYKGFSNYMEAKAQKFNKEIEKRERK